MAMAAPRQQTTKISASRSTEVLRLWQQSYGGELLILLPDTFGTTQFLAGAPDWVANWTGQRIDSKDPFVAGDEYIAGWSRAAATPRTKRLIASDGLDACATTLRPPSFHRASDFLDESKWIPERRASASAPAGAPS
jgi:nicotinate phosphoribosyltransferase